MKKPIINPASDTHEFRLYVIKGAPHSVHAELNLNKICKERLSEPYEIEIVDLLSAPERALADGILLTPTLVRIWPLPKISIFGDLSQTETVLAALGMEYNTNE